MSEDTARLVERVIDGDVDAFGEIVREYQDAIRAHLAARLADRHEADDLAQEVFLTAYSKIAQFDTSRPMRAWLRGISENTYRNFLRKRREKAKGAADEICDIIDSRIAARQQTRESDHEVSALERCLQSLDSGSRQLIEKRYAQELPLAQICQETRRKHSALTMALHRLRVRLRECIEGRLAVGGAQ